MWIISPGERKFGRWRLRTKFRQIDAKKAQKDGGRRRNFRVDVTKREKRWRGKKSEYRGSEFSTMTPK